MPLSVGSWVPIERNVTWVEAYLRIKWYPGASSRLATIHMGRNVGAAVPLSTRNVYDVQPTKLHFYNITTAYCVENLYLHCFTVATSYLIAIKL